PWLRARIAYDAAPAAAECLGGFVDRGGNNGKRFQWWFGLYLYVDDGLRKNLEAAHQFVQRAPQSHEAGHLEGREQAVAGRSVVDKNDVPGLFAAQIRAATQHLFEDVAVADGYTSEANAFCFESALQAQIRHG